MRVDGVKSQQRRTGAEKSPAPCPSGRGRLATGSGYPRALRGMNEEPCNNIVTQDNARRTEKLLSRQPVEEVWGVGHRLSRKLGTMGISTALHLARATPTFIRKNFNVVLERTVRELNGESCISLEDAPTEAANSLQQIFRRADYNL